MEGIVIEDDGKIALVASLAVRAVAGFLVLSTGIDI